MVGSESSVFNRSRCFRNYTVFDFFGGTRGFPYPYVGYKTFHYLTAGSVRTDTMDYSRFFNIISFYRTFCNKVAVNVKTDKSVRITDSRYIHPFTRENIFNKGELFVAVQKRGIALFGYE